MTLDPALAASIRLVVSDIDGTLVRNDKTLSERTVEAVRRAGEAGIAFTLISARPPSGLGELVDRLGLTGAVGAFNGGTLFEPGGRIVEAHRLEESDARRAIALLDEAEVPVWLFADGLWIARDDHSPHGDLERRAARQEPTIAPDFETWLPRADKVVGVSDDHALIARMEREIGQALGTSANVVRSQPYFLDVTTAVANKGAGVKALAGAAGIPLSETAAIGDMPNDVPMFEPVGLSVAMGQAPDEVRRAARHVTDTNEADGVAAFLDQLIAARS
ncbi:Cof-type HAD-IIB family hydrolase [Aureimonas sp. AU20]|uniref:Cof-type HAD-IIB family hydrolase n=1 Tax=Aureimonas sp. AU20 TaxID=1349819 RepID=UPI00072070DF|nr:Cof-type HAD-IIB family hydrolase [Aureimonas sp. AU20]ALN74450.1 hypothetical protein M673_17105 [Aureimonas sp. AU20]